MQITQQAKKEPEENKIATPPLEAELRRVVGQLEQQRLELASLLRGLAAVPQENPGETPQDGVPEPDEKRVPDHRDDPGLQIRREQYEDSINSLGKQADELQGRMAGGEKIQVGKARVVAVRKRLIISTAVQTDTDAGNRAGRERCGGCNECRVF